MRLAATAAADQLSGKTQSFRQTRPIGNCTGRYAGVFSREQVAVRRLAQLPYDRQRETTKQQQIYRIKSHVVK